MDDVKAQAVQRALRKRIEKFTSELLSEIRKTAERLTKDFNEIKVADDLPFSEKIKSKPKGIEWKFEIVFNCFCEEEQIVLNRMNEGADAFKTLVQVISEACKSKGKFEGVRYLANDIMFY